MDYIHTFVTALISFLAIAPSEKYFSHAGIPQIILKHEEVIVTAGRNFTFRCKGYDPIIWITPPNVNPKSIITEHTFSNSSKTDKQYELIINLVNVSVANVGYYTCVCEKYNNTSKMREHAIKKYLYVEDDKILLVPTNTVIKSRNKSSVVIPCRPAAPNIDFKLYIRNSTTELITKYMDKRMGYLMSIRPDDENFRVNCVATRNSLSQNIIFDIHIKDIPSSKLLSKKFYIKGDITNITCIAEGIPLPNITWYFKECIGDEACKFILPQEIDNNDYTLQVSEEYITSTLTTIANESGNVMCSAKNVAGIFNSSTPLYVTDVKDGFDIIGDEHTVVIGDDVTLKCVMSNYYNFSDTIHWLKMPENISIEVNNDNGYRLERNKTDLSNHLLLHIPNVYKPHAGEYVCAGEDENKTALIKTFILNVKSLESPEIISTNMNDSSVQYFLGEQNITFFCEVTGYPIPVVKWYKNDVEQVFDDADEDRIHLSDDSVKLHFKYIKLEDKGKYVCLAENKVASASKYIELNLKELPNRFSIIVAIGVTFICLVILVVGLILWKIKRDKELKNYLSNLGFHYFEQGAIALINPDLGIDEQAEYLPYDKKWEFPRENLTLGKQLGAGAYGIVIKGVAKGINEKEVTTNVAVKTVKTTADPIFVKNLVSELKILIHLGQHINVVNLLGACTMNIVNREFFIIVEYCRYGNLHNYLRRRRNIFINQIDPSTDLINYMIVNDQITNAENTQPDIVNDVQNNIDVNDMKNGLSNRPLTITGGNQPEWRFNFRADYNYKENHQLVSTKDLVCWSYQIASGLQFLASRNVIHGDLATRNILLSDNNIVKICDFGLAKRMFKSYYKKKSDGPLPIKWMAIESIRDRVFSTQSDVWAFGIVLWELFSLGCSPYPEMEADEKFFKNIFNGYRMSKPQYANDMIYKIMLECWRSNPMHRPTFTDLIKKIGDLLDSTTLHHFVNLNKIYLLKNKKQISEQDYLAMMSSPDYHNYACMSAKQDYVNAPNGGSFIVNPLSPEDIDADGYVMANRNDNMISNTNTLVALSNPIYNEILTGEEASGIENIPIILIHHDPTTNTNTDNGYSTPKPIVK